MEFVRMFPPRADYGCHKAWRTEEVVKAGEGGRPVPFATCDDAFCHCNESTAHTAEGAGMARTKMSGCLFSYDNADVTYRRSGFTTQQMMATEACYLPMMQPNYKSRKVHAMALWGTATESDLLEFIKRNPSRLKNKDTAGNTVLILACVARYPSSSVIRTLLDRSPKDFVNEKNNDGLTALHFAVLNDHMEIVSLLLERDADVNAGRVEVEGKWYGLTPVLMGVIASHRGRPTCTLSLLLARDPDLSVQTVAVNANHDDHLRFFMECACGGCSSRRIHSPIAVLPPSQILGGRSWFASGTAAHHAAKSGLETSLQLLLRTFAERSQLNEVLNEPIGEGWHTLFGVATFYCALRTMKLLLHTNSSVVNRATAYGDGREDLTPLHQLLTRRRCFANFYKCIACTKTRVLNEKYVTAVLTALLDCPAVNVEARTRSGVTPLMLAVQNGHDYILKRLLDSGANPLAVGGDGRTPVSLALNKEPGLCLNILRILFRTGLGHEIYKESFANSVVLNKLCEKRDIQILDFFRRTGALSDSNRVAMLKAAEKATVTAAEQEQKETFVQALTKANPWSLEKCALMCVSAKAGVRSAKGRYKAFRSTVHQMIQNRASGAPDQGDRCQNSGDEEEDRRQQVKDSDGITEWLHGMLRDHLIETGEELPTGQI